MVAKLTSAEFDTQVATGVSVIDFFAEWCGPCHEMALTIDALAAENEAVKFFKVDVDAEQQLAVRFGIQSIPTVFVLVDGKLAGQFVGVVAKAKIQDAIRKALGIA